MKTSVSSSTKLERKTVERNRRMQMKGLCFKLLSLVPKHFVPEANCQEDQLDGASVYIKKLEEKVAELKGRRDLRRSKQEMMKRDLYGGMNKPVVQVREFDSTLEVSLIDGMYIKFRFSDAISVLEEEGAAVVNASFSTNGGKTLYLIHSQVANSRVGLESRRIYERLKALVQ